VPTARQNSRSFKKGATNANSPLGDMDVHFSEFHKRHSPLFQTPTGGAGDESLQYFKGLIQAKKKNMERMAEAVPFSDDQALQHFLTNSPWDEQRIVDQIAADANQHIGGKRYSCLIIDETGFPKKGDQSVGVKRQWCGQLGKVDNCQVGVFSALGYQEHATPVGFKLYLPEDWTDDEERCEAAGIPDESIVFYSKHDLAFQLVLEARKQGIQFGWVGADGFYGENPAFLRSLDQINETFMVDVHKDQHIYLENPEPVVPERTSNKGPEPKKLKAQTEPIRVDKWLEQQPEEDWHRTFVRDTTKGKLLVDVLHKLVWLWDGEEPEANCWHLVARREVEGNKVKFSLSNAPENTPLERLIFMQAQRYWVERSFQGAKVECGLGEYQVRKWRSWHHHMAMVMMAMLFLLEQRLLYKRDIPLLSCFDIVCILSFLLPQRAFTTDEVFRQMEIRHKRRQSAIDSAYRKQLEE